VAIIPAGYGLHVIEDLLQRFDTLVLLKVKPLIDDIVDLLEKHELHKHSHFIEKAGSPDERIVHDIASLKGDKVNYLSLMIVKNPRTEREKIIRGCRKKASETESQEKSA